MSASMPPKKILILDDSPSVLLMAKTSLEAEGYAVETCDSAPAFIAIIRKLRPDLVLVDADLPVLDGALLIDMTRRHKLCTCPIFLHSSLPDAKLAELAKSCGADGFIPKSAGARALADTVRKILSGTVPSGT